MPVNLSFPGKDANGEAFYNPFAEQLEFLRNKLNLPTERYDDIIKSAHDRAFIVAGAAQADLLHDLNTAILKAAEQGRGMQEFRKDFDKLVLKNGWTGWTGEGSAAGRAWRTNIIYQTNMATSYAAGRWKQLNDPGLLAIRPYWRYIHADGIMHPRPLHVSWHGLVLRHDHPFWLTHFPPNGWMCHCRVTSADAADYAAAEAAGLSEPPSGWDNLDPLTGTLPGIDKGFNYAPGANVDQPLAKLINDKLIKLDAPIGASMYDAMRPVLRAEQEAAFRQFVVDVQANPGAQGRSAVVGAINPVLLEALATAGGVAPSTAAIAVEDSLIATIAAQEGAAARIEQLSNLPHLVDQPGQVLVDQATGRLLFVGQDAGAELALAEVDYLVESGGRRGNRVVSVFKMIKAAIQERIVAKLYEVLL